MLSGSQVTQHGISGYSQMNYGLFSGKAEQLGVADIDGRVTMVSATPGFTLYSLTPKIEIVDATTRNTFGPA